MRALAAIGAATAIVGALLIGVAVVAAPVAAVVPPPDTCGYPTGSGTLATVFLESTVMRAVQVIGTGTSAQIAGWANDEKGLLLGISDTTATATSFGPDPATGTQYYNHVPNAATPTISLGDTGRLDQLHRPLYPTVFITDITLTPTSTAGDWQHGGTPTTNIDDLFGSWTTASFVGSTYTPKPPAHQNHWRIGVGGDNVNYGADTPTGGFAALGKDEGFGSEVRWNVSGLHDEKLLPLVGGHTYRFQVMTHDGDQNKPGGDAGERCVLLTIPTPLQPSLAITKTADATPVSPGTSVGFQITVGNNGPTMATGVTLSDTLPSLTGITWTIQAQTASACSITGLAGSQILNCSLGDMAAGATYTVHITSPTTAGTSGALPNTACASASNAGRVCDLALIVVNPPNLAITKTADATPVGSGTSIGFTITVSNSGPGTATGVTVLDALPWLAGVDWTIDSDPGSHCLITTEAVLDQVLFCTIGNMIAGASYTVHITSPTTAATAGLLPNTACVAASNDGQVCDLAAIVVNPPGLAITKTADATPVDAGKPVGFAITVSSTGPGAATGVTLSDTLPSLTGVTWTIQSQTGSACSIGGAQGSQILSCTFGDMDAGTSYTIHVTSPTVACVAGTLPNTASASATNDGTVESSATIVVVQSGCTHTTPPPLLPSISIVKTADLTPVSAGSSVGFTIVVKSGGPATATNVTVNDPLPSLTGVVWTIDSDPGSHCSITGAVGTQVLSCSLGDMASGASYTVHISSPTTAATAGLLPNKACVSAGNDGTVCDSATIVVVPVLGEVATPPPAAAPAEAPAVVAAPAPLPKPAVLAFTGENVARMVRTGLLLLLLGGLLVLLTLVGPMGRRRRGVMLEPAPALSATPPVDEAAIARMVLPALRLLAVGFVLMGDRRHRD